MPFEIALEVQKGTIADKYEAHPNDVVIESCQVDAGSKKGDNNGCEVKIMTLKFRVREGEVQEDSFFVKCFPDNAFWVYTIKQCMFFRTEGLCYKVIYPKLNKIAAEHGIGKIQAPNCYYWDEDAGYIVLDDLVRAGYVMKDKKLGLEIPHLKLTLTELARLHALSYYWLSNYFGGIERFKKDYWTFNGDGWVLAESEEMQEMGKMMFGKSYKFFLMVLEHFQEDKELLAKAQAFAPIQEDKMLEAHKAKGSFTCVLHNDMWINNLMYKDTSSGAPDKVSLVDMQLSRRARPTVDLASFLATSTTPEIREKHTEELLSFYHDELSQFLTKLGFKEDVYPLAQIKEDYQECYAFGFLIALFNTQQHIADIKEEASFDTSKMTSEKEAAEYLKVVEEQDKLKAERNPNMTKRLVQLAQEAARMNII